MIGIAPDEASLDVVLEITPRVIGPIACLNSREARLNESRSGAALWRPLVYALEP